jgi:hypothetical protein
MVTPLPAHAKHLDLLKTFRYAGAQNEKSLREFSEFVMRTNISKSENAVLSAGNIEPMWTTVLPDTANRHDMEFSNEAYRLRQCRENRAQHTIKIGDFDRWSASMRHIQCGFSLAVPVHSPKYILERYEKKFAKISPCPITSPVDYPESTLNERNAGNRFHKRAYQSLNKMHDIIRDLDLV